MNDNEWKINENKLILPCGLGFYLLTQKERGWVPIVSWENYSV